MQKALAIGLCKMHSQAMRSHAEIVSAVGPEKLAAMRGVSVHTARSWAQRDGIPAEHWSALERERLATLKELAEYAAANPRKRPEQRSAA